MKKLGFCLLVLMIATMAFMPSVLSAAETSDPTQGEKVTIKIAHVSQAGVPIDVASLKLGEELNKKTPESSNLSGVFFYLPASVGWCRFRFVFRFVLCGCLLSFQQKLCLDPVRYFPRQTAENLIVPPEINRMQR